MRINKSFSYIKLYKFANKKQIIYRLKLVRHFHINRTSNTILLKLNRRAETCLRHPNKTKQKQKECRLKHTRNFVYYLNINDLSE